MAILHLDIKWSHANMQKDLRTKMAHDRHLDPDLLSFASAYGFPGVQLVQHLRLERRSGPVTLRRAEEWLGELRL